MPPPVGALHRPPLPSRPSIFRLSGVVQLVTPRSEELDAVVRRRIVRCEHHHAEPGTPFGNQERLPPNQNDSSAVCDRPAHLVDQLVATVSR